MIGLDSDILRKVNALRRKIRSLDSVMISFSGGVDSSVLTRICREELGERAVAVTALTDDYPKSDLSVASSVARVIGVKHVVMGTEMPVEQLKAAPKMARVKIKGAKLYAELKALASSMDIKHVVDGSHSDDVDENGSSFNNAKLHGVKSPMVDAGLTKKEIRAIAKKMKLPNWDRKASGKKKVKTKSANVKAINMSTKMKSKKVGTKTKERTSVRRK